MDARLASYDSLASVYDLLGDVYSGGGIRAVKRDQVNHLQPGASVLFVGCGAGQEVVAAARKGCQVTALDASPGMIDVLENRLKKADLSANLIADCVENIGKANLYDVVCANFFLNCFVEKTMLGFLTSTATLVRPGGQLMIADVAPPAGNIISRAVNRLYLHSAMFPFWLLGMVQWHPNHDYIASLRDMGWDAKPTCSVRMLGVGPVIFRNLVATRTGVARDAS
jgi:ubiquinone/menaquinone biosynthesis C-methylase UbiE